VRSTQSRYRSTNPSTTWSFAITFCGSCDSSAARITSRAHGGLDGTGLALATRGPIDREVARTCKSKILESVILVVEHQTEAEVNKVDVPCSLGMFLSQAVYPGLAYPSVQLCRMQNVIAIM
jgi:hypothetical protein